MYLSRPWALMRLPWNSVVCHLLKQGVLLGNHCLVNFCGLLPPPPCPPPTPCCRRREPRHRGKERLPLKSREWILSKKERRRKQGKWVVTSPAALSGWTLFSLSLPWFIGRSGKTANTLVERESLDFSPVHFTIAKITKALIHSQSLRLCALWSL